MKGVLVFAFFLYFPYCWCALSGSPRETFGLIWKAGRHVFLDVAAVSFMTLLPLTAASLFFFGDRLAHPALRSVPAAVLSGLAAAVAEETFFRGWVQTMLGFRFSRGWRIVLASAFFGLAHLASPYAPFAVLAFFPGLVMGYLRDRHGSVLPAILYHWIGNIWSIWLYPRF
jgi:hypothetical protein